MTLLLMLSTAQAYEADPQPFTLIDEANLFQEIEYESGWIPNGSPVAVDFRFLAEGGAYVEMEGESRMSWPEALTQWYEPYPGTGWFEMDTALVASANFRVDIWGYNNEWALVEESVGFYGEGEFDPWLLPGSEQESITAIGEGDSNELFNLNYNIVPGVGIWLLTELRPDAQGSFAGMRFTAGDQVIDAAGQTAFYPPEEGGRLELSTVFTALWGGQLDLVIVPSFGVDILGIGNYEVARFDFPITLANSVFEQDFPPVELLYEYPLMNIDASDIDFGDVEVGQIATHDLSVENLGSLVLDGDLGIMGDGEFSTFPMEIYAQGDGGTDGVTLTFAPTGVGPQEATLVINSSDPVTPDLTITMIGNGVMLDEGGDDDLKVINSEVGCGCSSAPDRGGLGVMAAALFGLVALRRRKG